MLIKVDEEGKKSIMALINVAYRSLGLEARQLNETIISTMKDIVEEKNEVE